MSIDYLQPLIENNFYHIYNRGNNKENIFFKTENYHYFLRKLDLYLSDFIDIYAYCLLPNHFHLLVRVKDRETIVRLSKFSKLGKSFTEPSEIISEAFRRFFMSYSKSINIQQTRTGSLFQKNFKRKIIENDEYLTSTIKYIHTNPQKHQICDDYKLYEHSSYQRILIDKPTKLKKTEVINWFGGIEDYIDNHEINLLEKNISEKIEIDD